MTNNCWTVLGIEPTQNSQIIKHAYTHLLKDSHPDDNPEGFAQLQQAYEAALNYCNQPSDSETTVKESDTEVDPEPDSKPNRKVFIAAGWLLAMFVLFRVFSFLSDDRRQAAQQAEQEALIEVKWEPDLLQCNDVVDATETPQFKRCIELAKQGWEEAQRRVAWAYTREGEHQDWSAAYEYITELGEYDYYMDFLGDIVLFLLGETESAQIKGEREIRAKANLRFPPAEGYLATIYGLEINLLERDANILWLLESAYEKSEVVVDVYEMTQVYANGIKTRVNLDKARAVLADYAASNSPYSLEGAAWYLATLANNQLHPPEVAVQMAKTIIDYEDETELYSFYDTLAAAYAANQQFDEATDTQKQAIALIDKSSLSAAEAEQERENYTERLESYQQQQAIVYADLVISEDEFFDDLKTDIEVMLIELLDITVEAPQGYTPPVADEAVQLD
ncbi:J domain-containing protein [Alteromonas sp. ASW11-36]|uniref:J domain-containing protein n=1 Tax=Alteromonas arenosi TaxID=3055817 RepID=A0ABT7SSP3_9ALTE|nr:J domain-containing protein [Alteromonas sp. ASW11-36]MDM7859212.1 J domain-containing protein [Alteromonas sp. ASW11-36]